MCSNNWKKIGTKYFELIFSDISAYPPHVNILDGIENDVRTPDKLVNGINDTKDGYNMWLAPIISSQVS